MLISDLDRHLFEAFVVVLSATNLVFVDYTAALNEVFYFSHFRKRPRAKSSTDGIMLDFTLSITSVFHS